MEKINIAEILKDCPEGTKLYTTVWGDVEFIEYNSSLDLIKVSVPDSVVNQKLLYGDGSYTITGECILFPSKEQRDWSKFKTPLQVEQFEPCECYWYKITGDKEQDAALLDKIKDLMPDTTYLYVPGSDKFEKGKIVYNNVNHIEVINDVDRTFSQIVKMIGVELKVKE